MKPVYDTPRMTVRHFVLPGRDSILLAGVHLPSKLYTSDADQALLCVDLCRDLAFQEDKLGHARTVLVGDFNMNPFEHGVASSRGLNAVMTRAIAGRGSRIVDSKDHRFFYNPMWNHFGDSGPNPPGTYYYEGSPHMWNMFDQVLVRPALLDRFVDGELRVLDAVKGLKLINNRKVPDVDVGTRITCRSCSHSIFRRQSKRCRKTISTSWPSDLDLATPTRSPVTILRQQSQHLVRQVRQQDPSPCSLYPGWLPRKITWHQAPPSNDPGSTQP